MLDKHISPDDYETCPECDGEVHVKGDKWEGSKWCVEDDCDFEDYWDNLP